jgi:hypothetical protein
LAKRKSDTPIKLTPKAGIAKGMVSQRNSAGKNSHARIPIAKPDHRKRWFAISVISEFLPFHKALARKTVIGIIASAIKRPMAVHGPGAASAFQTTQKSVHDRDRGALSSPVKAGRAPYRKIDRRKMSPARRRDSIQTVTISIESVTDGRTWVLGVAESAAVLVSDSDIV